MQGERNMRMLLATLSTAKAMKILMDGKKETGHKLPKQLGYEDCVCHSLVFPPAKSQAS